MTKNVILTGFMGTGKTSVGTRLARDLHFEFIDTDTLIEADQKMSITAIFEKFGEPYFREAEAAIIRTVTGRENQVVSTGGGAVIRDSNREAFRKSGYVVCLTASPEVIFERIRREIHRPLLQTPDPLARIRELLDSRAGFYAQADTVIDTSALSLEEVVQLIKERIKHAYC